MSKVMDLCSKLIVAREEDEEDPAEEFQEGENNLVVGEQEAAEEDAYQEGGGKVGDTIRKALLAVAGGGLYLGEDVHWAEEGVLPGDDVHREEERLLLVAEGLLLREDAQWAVNVQREEHQAEGERAGRDAVAVGAEGRNLPAKLCLRKV